MPSLFKNAHINNIKNEIDSKNIEIKNLKIELNKANKIIEQQKIAINDLQNQLNNININNNLIEVLNNKINQKDQELNKLKSELNNLKLELENIKSQNKKYVDMNKIMCVNFISSDQNIHYAATCLKTNTFAEVEEKLYKQYPEYRETNNYFISNGKKILKSKTIEENNIGNGLPVILYMP